MSVVIATAQRTLQQYWDRTLPINPFSIAYNMGVEIRFNPMLTVSGYYDNAEGNPVIHINPNESIVRQRFTVFHELGHYCLNHPPSPRDPSQVYNQTNYVSNERDANMFAAEMIMPMDYVLFCANNGYRLSDMANTFGVSEQAMRIRLERLGILGGI